MTRGSTSSPLDEEGNFGQGESLPHKPVLYQEAIEALQPRQGGHYVDGTLGAGGHALGILEASSPDGKLLGLDVDPQALDIAVERLSVYSDRTILRRASYSSLLQQLSQVGWDSVNGILLDLGLSSMQLDTPDRGFSFRTDAALDMRFDPSRGVSAAEIVNQSSETELADMLFKYGEERHSRRIARAVIAERPIDTTAHLARIVAASARTGRRKSKAGQVRVHPATRTFQALRIVVNQELEALELFLPQTIPALGSGGRLVVISYHSLEDRLVKEFIRRESRDCICPPRQPVCTCGHKAQLVEVVRKPIRPREEEVGSNPRSRSARMRAAQKI